MLALIVLVVVLLQLALLAQWIFLLYPLPAALVAAMGGRAALPLRGRKAPRPRGPGYGADAASAAPALGLRPGVIAVLIPAHDEAAVLPGTLAALAASRLPAGVALRAYVVADNATDATAAVARAHGAEVLERSTGGAPSTKGQALSALWREAARGARPDAVVILDADNHVRPDALARLWAAFGARPDAVIQGRRVPKADGLEAGVARLDGLTEICTYRIGCAGRAALGLNVPLMGSGVLIGADRFDELVESPAHGVIEDCEWQALLAVRGQPIRYCPEAVVEDQKTARAASMGAQRKRWLSGKAQVARAYGPALLARFLRRGDWQALDTALYMTALPRVLLVAGALAFALLGALLPAAGFWPPAFWLALLAFGLGSYVVSGLRLDGAGFGAIARSLGLLVHLPRFAWQMLGGTLAALAGRRVLWERTERSA